MPRDIKHKNFREGMEVFSAIQKQTIRDNFAALAKPYVDQVMNVSDVSVVDLMINICQYAGRIEVRNFGTFIIREIKGRDIVNSAGQVIGYKHGYRRIEFAQSKLLRDLINEDVFGQVVPTPNSDYFVEERNIYL